MNQEKIQLRDIDWNKNITFYSSPVTSNSLQKSIEQYGILCLPILYPLKDGKYMIVSGWQRLLVLSKSKQDDFVFEANVMPEREYFEKECMDLSLSDNLSHRNLDLLEKAEFIGKLKNELHIDDKTITDEYFSILMLHRNVKILQEMLMIYSFSAEQKKRIRLNNYSVEYFTCLLPYEKDLRTVIIDIALELNLGVNVIKEISLNAYEISKRDNKCSVVVLKEILSESKKLSRREKIDYIRESLYKKRYPKVFQKKEHMETLIKDCSFPPKIKLKVPVSLEGSKISLSMDVSSNEELMQYLDAIESADKDGYFQKIWDFMKL